MPDSARGPMPDSARGPAGPLVLGSAQLPDAYNPSECYRPPIDRISEEFLRGVVSFQVRGRSDQQGGQVCNSPGQARSVAWSVSTGASFCSSASSTGSTPTGGRGRRGTANSPYQVSPAVGRAHLPHSALAQDPKQPSSRPHLGGAPHHHLSGTTATPASSPHGSSASATACNASGAGGAGASSQTPLRSQPGGSTGPAHRGPNSRDGSRGSSPWHLPSPTLSTASDRMNSGSDSCGENPIAHYEGAHFDGWDEDPSQSDGVYQGPRWTQSDSDGTGTPRSNDTVGQDHDRGGKESQPPRWENIPQLSRTQLSRGRLPRGDADVTQSPGSMGSMSNFREKVGMNEGGPVVPFAPGARRDALGAMVHREAADSGEASGAPAAADAAGSAAASASAAGVAPGSGALRSSATGVAGMLGGPQRAGGLRRPPHT